MTTEPNTPAAEARDFLHLSAIEDWYELARKCGINVNDGDGELRPDIDQADAPGTASGTSIRG